mmetsp:Transcript_7513/g.11379  ORF Transcript_7513/g.11379 Transcript_7513/m.11379 type:complete len:156 (+) Transcript_7513:37-504(+)
MGSVKSSPIPNASSYEHVFDIGFIHTCPNIGGRGHHANGLFRLGITKDVIHLHRDCPCCPCQVCCGCTTTMDLLRGEGFTYELLEDYKISRKSGTTTFTHEEKNVIRLTSSRVTHDDELLGTATLVVGRCDHERLIKVLGGTFLAEKNAENEILK